MKKITIKEMQLLYQAESAVSWVFGVRVTDFYGQSRLRPIVEARFCLFWILTWKISLNSYQIAAHYTKERTNVSYANKRFAELCDTDLEYQSRSQLAIDQFIIRKDTINGESTK